jgi:hypothetical protein
MTADRIREADLPGVGGNCKSQHPLMAQSLAKGAAGNALLAIERALSGEGSWRDAHAQITAAVSQPVIASVQAGLFHGAPAISFMLSCAQADGSRRYHAASKRIDSQVIKLTDRRLLAAEARLGSALATAFAEYDLFYGLTGIGALLLRQAPGSATLGRILTYLVRLSLPRADGLPGWWVTHDPDPSLPTPGGHANTGMAHGLGFLSLLAMAARAGVTVEGHHDAMDTICDWLDRWQQEDSAGPWWPRWIGREALASGHPEPPGPARASWCYGTPGISRAIQQAAIALGDTARQQQAEQALACCLSDAAQIELIAGSGLCHGIAGVYQTAWRAARDALTPAIAMRLPALSDILLHREPPVTSLAGFLDGATGLSLARRTAASPARPPASGWDACLLITG